MKAPAIALSLLFAGSLLVGGCAGLRQAEAEASVLAADAAWHRSYLPGQRQVLRTLLSEDFTQVTPSGQVLTRQEVLNSSDLRAFHKAQPYESHLRFVSPEVAVVTGAAELMWTDEGRLTAGRYRYTHLFRREDKGWRLVHAQQTPLVP